MIRQAWAVWRSDQALPIMGARCGTYNRIPLLLTARWINGTLFTIGREPRSGGRARQEIKKEMSDVSGHIDLDAAIPVQASAITRRAVRAAALYWASGRSGVVNLVAAHNGSTWLL